MTQRSFHRLVSNLDCIPDNARSNPGEKSQEIDLLGGLVVEAEPRVDVARADIIGQA
jgi:hypothetical protein